MPLLERPLRELEHLDIQRVPDDLAIDHLERMARRERVKEVRFVLQRGQVVHVLDELAEPVHVAF